MIPTARTPRPPSSRRAGAAEGRERRRRRHAANAPVRLHRAAGAVGEHHRRSHPEHRARADPDRHRRQPAAAARPLRRRRQDPAGGAAPGPGGPRQRPEPRRGDDQQGADRNPAALCQHAAGESAGPRAHEQRRGLERRAGLAADVRYYGEWMRERAWERIGHLYPTHNGETVIAWLWARTVKCPNPACGAQMPLVSSFG